MSAADQQPESAGDRDDERERKERVEASATRPGSERRHARQRALEPDQRGGKHAREGEPGVQLGRRWSLSRSRASPC